MEIKNGILLGSSQYKDFDAITTILFEDRISSVLIKNAFNPNCINHIFINKLIFANLEIYQGKTNGLKLKTGKIINSFSSLRSNFDDLSILNFISELLIKCVFIDEYKEVYNLTLSILNGLSNHKDRIKSISYFLIKITKILGINLNLNTCVICGLKNNKFNLLSFKEGGVVCNNHYNQNENFLLLDNQELTALRKIYDLDDFTSFKELDTAFLFQYFIGLCEMLENNFSITLNSKNLIKYTHSRLT